MKYYLFTHDFVRIPNEVYPDIVQALEAAEKQNALVASRLDDAPVWFPVVGDIVVCRKIAFRVAKLIALDGFVMVCDSSGGNAPTWSVRPADAAERLAFLKGEKTNV